MIRSSPDFYPPMGNSAACLNSLIVSGKSNDPAAGRESSATELTPPGSPASSLVVFLSYSDIFSSCIFSSWQVKSVQVLVWQAVLRGGPPPSTIHRGAFQIPDNIDNIKSISYHSLLYPAIFLSGVRIGEAL